jgi:hypothetical protein
MEEQQPHAKVTGDFHQITVEDLYDKEKYDLSTMEQQDVMQLLQYVFFDLFFIDVSQSLEDYVSHTINTFLSRMVSLYSNRKNT